MSPAVSKAIKPVSFNGSGVGVGVFVGADVEVAVGIGVGGMGVDEGKETGSVKVGSAVACESPEDPQAVINKLTARIKTKYKFL